MSQGGGSTTGSTGQGGSPPVPRTAREMLSLARGFLERKGLGEARLEAELLVAHALEVDRLGLFMRLDAPIQGAELDRSGAVTDDPFHAKALDARFPFPAASVNVSANTSIVFAPSPEGVNVAV